MRVTHTLYIPDFQPATLNQLLGCHWATKNRLKKADAQAIGLAARLAGIPRAAGKRRVSLTLVLGPRQRGPDPDACFKSLLDALVSAGLLVDDSKEWCELSPVGYERGARKATRILLEDVE